MHLGIIGTYVTTAVAFLAFQVFQDLRRSVTAFFFLLIDNIENNKNNSAFFGSRSFDLFRFMFYEKDSTLFLKQISDMI